MLKILPVRVMILSLFLTTNLWAQNSMERSVVAAGGSEMQGGGYTIRGTAGQPVIGPVETASMHSLQGFWYQVLAGSTTPVDGPSQAIGAFQLEQNYPNPFGSSTIIDFAVSVSSHVTLTIFDNMGRVLAEPVDAPLVPGNYSLLFEARGLPPGVYVYRLAAAGTHIERSMLLVK